MADEKSTDWSLADDDRGHVILPDGRREDLGPRDEAFVRFADFMGEGGPA